MGSSVVPLAEPAARWRSGPWTLKDARREYLRFPIEMDAEGVLNGTRFSAITANLGRGGIYLRTKELLPIGKLIRLSMDWPALLDGRCPLSLSVIGRVIRREPDGAAVRILRYEFRLRRVKPAKSAGAQPSTAADSDKNHAQ